MLLSPSASSCPASYCSYLSCELIKMLTRVNNSIQRLLFFFFFMPGLSPSAFSIDPASSASSCPTSFCLLHRPGNAPLPVRPLPASSTDATLSASSCPTSSTDPPATHLSPSTSSCLRRWIEFLTRVNISMSLSSSCRNSTTGEDPSPKLFLGYVW